MAKLNNPAAKAIKRRASSGHSVPQAYNLYNLYFILEREMFLQSKGVFPNLDSQLSSYQRSDSSAIDYTGLDLPSFPPKYSSLILPSDWFVHKKKKKRAHVKTHGLVSFREMATTVASNWKTEKSEVVEFVKAVSALVKDHHSKEMMSKSKEANAPVSPMHSLAVPLKAHLDSAIFELLPVRSSSIPNEQDRIQRMMDFLADAVSPSTSYAPPSWSWEIDPLREVQCATTCFSASKDQKLRRASTSSTIAQLDLPDSDILAMWTSA